jgi:hypothetical protein
MSFHTTHQDFTSRLEEFSLHVAPKQTWAILDVDRVLLRGTSWYHACMVPDLLIPATLTSTFAAINEATYGQMPCMSPVQMREEVLSLLGTHVKEQAVNVVRRYLGSSPHVSNETMSLNWMYTTGRVAANLVGPHPEALELLGLLSRICGSHLNVVFLSAGYEPFIRGVVDEIVNTYGIRLPHYLVFGSGIAIEDGRCYEIFQCDGPKKRAVAECIYRHGGAIAFAADDADENLPLLDFVREAGGISLQIKHQPGAVPNRSWSEFLDSFRTEESITTFLRTFGPTRLAGAVNNSPLLHTLNSKLAGSTDRIGTLSLSVVEFYQAMIQLDERVGRESRPLSRIARQLVLIRDGRAMLRGPTYYHWVPVLSDRKRRSRLEAWWRLLRLSVFSIHALIRGGIFQRLESLSVPEQLVVLMFLDHYKLAVYEVSNVAFRADVGGIDCVNRSDLELIDRLCEEATNYYYAALLDQPAVRKITMPAPLEIRRLRGLMTSHVKLYQGMRELDDPLRIAESVLSQLEQLEASGEACDVIVSFLYGGMELGLAFRALHTLRFGNIRAPILVQSTYSSRRARRERGLSGIPSTISSFLEYIPSIYRDSLRRSARSGSSFLLYDHNVTTFRTLQEVSEAFRASGCVVSVAAAAVHFPNLARWILNDPSAEVPCGDWQQTLTYRPSVEYVSAFDTWGTSEKSRILADMLEASVSENRVSSSLSLNGRVFKACRVHNNLDLQAVLAAGATAIGIHAVYPNLERYLSYAKRFNRGSQVAAGLPSNLLNRLATSPRKLPPVPWFELRGIRRMMREVPDGLDICVLFESMTSPEMIAETLDLLGIQTTKCALQLQHRITADYLQSIRSQFKPTIIAAVGADQVDVREYFSFLQTVLDESSDFILLDLSGHQPDLIDHKGLPRPEDHERALMKLSSLIRTGPVPTILANDTDVSTMNRHLALLTRYEVEIAGIDMQNSLEIDAERQQYHRVSARKSSDYILPRKSHKRLREWAYFVEHIYAMNQNWSFLEAHPRDTEEVRHSV